MWGNGSSTVVSKLYRVVRILSALYETKLRIFNDLKRNGNSRVLSLPFLASVLCVNDVNVTIIISMFLFL